MPRLLLRYVLLPFMLLILLGYAAIPLWVPSLAGLLLKPYSWLDVEITVGYPSHKNWHIEGLSWRQEHESGSFYTSLRDLSLTYTWQSINAQQWPYFIVGEALAVIEAKPKSLALIPSIALIPSQWLAAWPKFKINKFNLELITQGQQFDLSGQLENQPEGLNLISKILTPSQQQLYLDANFGADDKVDAKLFSRLNSAPVAKITSAIKRQAETYMWHGQGAVDLAYSQHLLADFLPIDVAQALINQCKLNSHWKINLPATIDETSHANFDSWLNQAQGELQSQIQLSANHPSLKELYLDASLTQIFNPNIKTSWRLNEGSSLRISPAWDNTKIDPNLYQSLLLEQAQLTFSAASPVVIERLQQQSLLGTNTSLRLLGNINATLENTHSMYQVFGQLSELQMHAINHWQGLAKLSGYYLAQTEANPWMTQLPIDLRQLQFLSNVAFDFDPKQWHFKVQPKSKISATQVESRRQAGIVQLFASDKLNLTNDQIIELAYLPSQDYWTWSNASVHLRPESIPSQGLEIKLGDGSTLLSNQPLQGSFELRPTSVNLPDWPPFQAQSTGQLNWLDGQLNISFTSQLPPYINAIDGQYMWQADSAEHQLLLQVKGVDLPPLMPQLNQLENTLQLPAPLLANMTRGVADYEADWHWNDAQLTGVQKFNYFSVDAHTKSLNVTDLAGQSEFTYQLARPKNTSTPSQGGGFQDAITGQLDGHHQINAKQLSWGTGTEKTLLKPKLTFKTQGWSEVQYEVEKINAQWLGGRVLGQAVVIQSTGLTKLPISVEGIKLKRLIKLANTPNLNASGEVSGVINVALNLTPGIEKTWRLTDASLASSKVGTIRYLQTETLEGVQKSNDDRYLEQILSEFKFQQLSAELTQTEDEKMQLLTRFIGSNDYFEEGRKVDFSLTLTPQLN